MAKEKIVNALVMASIVNCHKGDGVFTQVCHFAYTAPNRGGLWITRESPVNKFGKPRLLSPHRPDAITSRPRAKRARSGIVHAAATRLSRSPKSSDGKAFTRNTHSPEFSFSGVQARQKTMQQSLTRRGGPIRRDSMLAPLNNRMPGRALLTPRRACGSRRNSRFTRGPAKHTGSRLNPLPYRSL
ncbi:MAG: hypothetical protein U1E47_05500 [Rivihabitans pingtungensis]